MLIRISKRKAKLPRIPKIKSIDPFIKQYSRLLGDYVDEIKKIFIRIVLPYLDQLSSAAQAEGITLRDSWDDQLEQLTKAFNLALSSEQDLNRTRTTIQYLGGLINKQNSEETQRIIKTLFNVNTAMYEPWVKSVLSSFVKEGVTLIKDLTTKTEGDLFKLIQKDIKQGKRVETIKKEILTGTNLKPGYFTSVKTRAELIARDQVGKFNGQVTRLRQESLGITLYIWRTSGDERVRIAHAVLNGKICSWKDPTVYADTIDEAIEGKWKSRNSIGAFIGDPGEDYNCRCDGEPVFDTILEKV